MLDVQDAPQLVPSTIDQFRFQRVGGMDRLMAFQLSQDSFAAAFDAEIEDDTEEFYAVIDRSGNKVAAFGLNRHANQMACSKYLPDQDVSLAVRRCLPRRSDNLRLVELCHLGLVNGRVFCQMLPLLARFLAQHADALICTTTSQLAKHFVQRGFASHRAAEACVTHLPIDEQNRWGTYYQTNPQVLVGDLALASTSRGVCHAA